MMPKDQRNNKGFAREMLTKNSVLPNPCYRFKFKTSHLGLNKRVFRGGGYRVLANMPHLVNILREKLFIPHNYFLYLWGDIKTIWGPIEGNYKDIHRWYPGLTTYQVILGKTYGHAWGHFVIDDPWYITTFKLYFFDPVQSILRCINLFFLRIIVGLPT